MIIIEKLRQRIKLLNMPEMILVGTIACITSVLNMLHVILGAAQTPEGTKYLWISHYYVDYFEYVQQISQGIRGRWLVENPYTPFDPVQTLIGWGQYLYMGKIAAFFHISAITTYQISTFTFSFFLCILIFFLIKQLLKQHSFASQIVVFLISIYAVPFSTIITVDGVKQLIPYNFWYAPITYLNRFGNVPHHLTAAIVTIILIFILSHTLHSLQRITIRQMVVRLVVIVLLLSFVMTFAAFQGINLIVSLGITEMIILIRLIIQKQWNRNSIRYIVFPVIMGILLLPVAYYIYYSHNQPGLFQYTKIWEQAQQEHPPLLYILLTIGPVCVFSVFGLIRYFKSFSVVRLLFFSYVLISYILYATPLAVFFSTFNQRFLTPLSYVLFSVLTLLGLQQIARILKIKQRILIIIFLLFFIPYSIYINILTLRSFIRGLESVRTVNYLPVEIYEGFTYLDKQPDRKIVLTSPRQEFGAIIPIFSNKKVYLGRMMFTPDIEYRAIIMEKFFLGTLELDEVKKLVKDNNVGYAYLSTLENYPRDAILQYGLFDVAYKNTHVIIYKVK